MINVLFFAHLQEQLGKSSLQIESDKLTVAELKQKLQSTYSMPELNRVMTAVNEEYAADEDLIHAGDTVAFIPPVSGG